jgi:hypothetical protein
MLKYVAAVIVGVSLMGTLSVPVRAQGIGMEAAEHPRIATAIRQMEDAIAYMQAAPNDFGGHKAAAIRATQAAIEELRAALAFRARVDRP